MQEQESPHRPHAMAANRRSYLRGRIGQTAASHTPSGTACTMIAVPFAFRIRFVLSTFVRLNNAPEEALRIAAGSGEDVKLRALQPNEALNDADQLVVIGRGYGTEEAARAAGTRWRGFTERALARVNVAADFGDRAPGSAWTAVGLAEIARKWNVERVVQDAHGLMVFEEEPWPKFVLSTLNAVV